MAETAKLSEDQIHYLRTVLGVDSVVLPGIDPAAKSEFITSAPVLEDGSQWRSSGDENAAKILCLVSSETTAFPLDGDSGELTRKMIDAMKLLPSEVYILEWTHAHTPAPKEIMQTLLRTAKPALIFGAGTARSVIGHFPKIGEWSSFEGVRFVATESPLDLLARPELKRVAWAHMQAFMKGLSFG